jgi:LuxR family maltose regulon positive regulatory protein
MVEERSPASALLQVELGNLLFERNHLEEALSNLQEALAVANPWRITEALIPGYTGLARLRAAQGYWEVAFAALDELAVVGENHPQMVKPVVEAYRARLWAAQGSVDAARGWMETVGLDAGGEMEAYREDEYLILARVLIAQGEAEKAAGLLSRLLERAEESEKLGKVIEILILQGLVLQSRDEREQALTALGKALELAESENYIRIFVDEGIPMKALLARMKVEDEKMKEYVRKLLAAFRDNEFYPSSTSLQPLIERLSEREIEVLQLIAEGLTNPEIASRLYLSLNTVKVHTRNIYGKLGVHNRTLAVTRARALGILPST